MKHIHDRSTLFQGGARGRWGRDVVEVVAPWFGGGGGHGFSKWRCGEEVVVTRHRRGDTSCWPPLAMVLLLEMWFERYRVLFTLIVKRGEVKTFRSICSPSWSHRAWTKKEQRRAMLEQHEYQKNPAVRPVVVEKLIILWWSIPAHFSRFPKSQINSVFVKNRFITLLNLTFVDGLKRIAKSFLHLLIFDFFFGLCFLACFQNFRRMAFEGARKQLVACCFARLLPQWWLTALQRLDAQTSSIDGDCSSLIAKFCQFWATNDRMAFTSHCRDLDFIISIPNGSTHIHQFVPSMWLSNLLPFKDVHRMTFFCHFKKAVDDDFDGFTAFDLVKERYVGLTSQNMFCKAKIKGCLFNDVPTLESEHY